MNVFGQSSRLCVIWLTMALMATPVISQELSATQKRDLIEARDQIGQAAIDYRAGRFDAAGQALQTAHDRFLVTLRAMEPDLRKKTIDDMAALLQRMETAHAMIQLEGVTMDPIRIKDGTKWWLEEPIQTADPPVGPKTLKAGSDTTSPMPTDAAGTSDADSEQESTATMSTPAIPSQTISFLNDVAPILMENCNGCHFDAMRVRGGLRMDTFAQLLRGGDEGESIDPGSGDDSILVMRMRGEGGDLMPGGGRPAVSDEKIALIARWIDQGAIYDGQREEASIRDERKQAWLQSAGDEEISVGRAETSMESIRLVVGSQRINSTEVGPFLILGSAPVDRLKQVGRVAEEQMKIVESLIAKKKGTDDRHYFHGKATIFVLPRQYDYSEFVGMVEQRRVPTDWTSHFRYTGLAAYVTVVASASTDDEQLRDRLSSPLIGLAMASRAVDVPDWLSRGVGESITNTRVRRLDRAARLRLQEEIVQAAAATKSAKDFLGDRLAAEQKDALATALAGSMMDGTRRRAFTQLIRSLNEDASFEDAFKLAYNATPEAYINAYLKWVGR